MALKETLFRATVGAAMVALSGGAAMAAGPSAGVGTAPSADVGAAGSHAGTGTGATGGTNLGANEKSGAAASGSAGTEANAKPTTPPKSIVGKDVVNTKGEKIGEVSKIAGDQVIVSSGGFLGIGSHDVAIPWSQVTMEGAGKNAKVQLSMTKDELKQMPEYKEEKSAAPAGGANTR